MSRENVEIVRRIYEAVNRGDLDAGWDAMAPNIEWDTTVRGADGGVVHGREQVRAVTEAWLDAWDEPRVDLLRAVASKDSVVIWVRQHARGKASGIEGDLEWWAVLRFRDGKLTHYREYPSWGDALEAEGLRE